MLWWQFDSLLLLLLRFLVPSRTACNFLYSVVGHWKMEDLCPLCACSMPTRLPLQKKKIIKIFPRMAIREHTQYVLQKKSIFNEAPASVASEVYCAKFIIRFLWTCKSRAFTRQLFVFLLMSRPTFCRTCLRASGYAWPKSGYTWFHKGLYTFTRYCCCPASLGDLT